MSLLANVNEQDHKVAGELQAGFLVGSVKNVGETVALVNGVPLASGEAKGYPFVGKGYNAIPFDPQGSILRVLEII